MECDFQSEIETCLLYSPAISGGISHLIDGALNDLGLHVANSAAGVFQEDVSGRTVSTLPW